MFVYYWVLYWIFNLFHTMSFIFILRFYVKRKIKLHTGVYGKLYTEGFDAFKRSVGAYKLPFELYSCTQCIGITLIPLHLNHFTFLWCEQASRILLSPQTWFENSFGQIMMIIQESIEKCLIIFVIILLFQSHRNIYVMNIVLRWTLWWTESGIWNRDV